MSVVVRPSVGRVPLISQFRPSIGRLRRRVVGTGNIGAVIRHAVLEVERVERQAVETVE